jgi:hypothetical protein
MSRPQLYRRPEASRYLQETWSITRSPQTLAKYAVQGGGPKMVYVGRIPHYTKATLDAYARSVFTPPVASTAELKVLRNGGRQ